MQVNTVSLPRTSRLIALLGVCAVLLTSGCAGSPPVDHARLSEPNARSVLILPPTNRTTAAQAGELYYTSLAVPLTRAGFYVYPAWFTQQLMHQEGIVDGAQLDGVPWTRFYELFGADMVLTTRITSWDTTYVVFAGSVTVAVEFALISTQTGNTLWQHRERRVADTGSHNASFLGRVLETALNTAQQDYIPLARELNAEAFAHLPYGPYHPNYMTEAEFQQRLQAWQDDQR